AGRLNSFAVFAFCAESTRLPGHCWVRSPPVNATAHTTPSRSTIVAHMLFFRNPLFCATAAVSAALNSDQEGNVLHPVPGASLGPCALGAAGFIQDTTTMRPITDRFFFIGLPLRATVASSSLSRGRTWVKKEREPSRCGWSLPRWRGVGGVNK